MDSTTVESKQGPVGDSRAFIVVAIQVVLVLWTVYQFRIVDDFGFTDIVPLLIIGFIIHSLLPLRYREPFFVLISLAAIIMVLPFPYNIILIVAGLGMIALCHLPIPYTARVFILLAVGALLAFLRNGWDVFPEAQDLAALVIPMLGAIFMFRLIIYMYDLQHEKKPVPVSTRLAYFFMVPNICFLLYPVVDYRTFQRTHYDTNAVEIYQKGALWILRGLIHLLLYRVVYGLFSPSPESVNDFGDVIEYMVATYLLYLRISGQFHLIVGILCLFGYNLPETHRLFYFASGFNDFWRRINIYWKDFMMKIVYYPVFIRVRKLGMIPGMTIATLAVFFGTWALHSYQWFWLRGSFPITAPDMIFWAILAVFVVINSILQSKTVRKRTITGTAWSLRGAMISSVKTVSFFSLMCVLWSLWNSATVEQWLGVVSKASLYETTDFLILLAVLATAFLLGVLLQFLASNRQSAAAVNRWRELPSSPAYVISATVLLLCISNPQFRAALPSATSAVVEIVQEDRLNVHDTELVERGYYEDLLDNPSFTSTLSIVRSESQRPRTKDWVRIRDAEFVNMTDDFLEFVLMPAYSGSFKDAEFSTNSLGLRDKEYAIRKPSGTLRIVVLGASMEMAAGVKDDEVFEAVLEQQLNAARQEGDYDQYEIMNFSVGGYGMTQKLMVLSQYVDQYQPDIILLPLYNTEDTRTLTHLTNIIRNDAEIPYPALAETLSGIGVDGTTPLTELRLKLRPKIDDIVRWSIDEIAGYSERQGYELIPVYLPLVRELQTRIDQSRRAKLIDHLEEKELRYINLENVFDGTDTSELQLASWDTHLSVQGHRIVAEALGDELGQSGLLKKMPDD